LRYNDYVKYKRILAFNAIMWLVNYIGALVLLFLGLRYVVNVGIDKEVLAEICLSAIMVGYSVANFYFSSLECAKF
jgi:hypothetical protein